MLCSFVASPDLMEDVTSVVNTAGPIGKRTQPGVTGGGDGGGMWCWLRRSADVYVV